MEETVLTEQVEERDPLHLDLDDEQFAQIVDERVEALESWYRGEKNLFERQERNKRFYFGTDETIDADKLKSHEARYIDNVIFEGQENIRAIALSQMPDLLVKPGNESEESREVAKQLTEVINNDLRKREQRQVLDLAFRHRPVYLIGVIKCLWNPYKGEHGDYEFRVVHPENILLDNVGSSDPDDMEIIVEKVPMTVKEVLMKFPDKKDEFLEAVGVVPSMDGKARQKKLASRVDINEVHFTWYQEKEDRSEPEDEEDRFGMGDTQQFDQIEAVAWKYKDVVLRKMKSPYWDWEGEVQIKVEDETGAPQRLEGREMMQQLIQQGLAGMVTERVFNNHFRHPRKPYIFIVHQNWGEMPHDETSTIEQVIRLQENVNKRGKQITEMTDRARAKHIWSLESGLKKDDIEEFDFSDPDQDIVVDGNLREVHEAIFGEQPNAVLYQDQSINRDRIFAKMGVHSTTRGEVETETATTAQIARESDFGKIDNLAENTVNYAAEEMANWSMHMIKLRYTEDHFQKILGSDGSFTFTKVNRDMIEDDMEVTVHASGVDKILRKREAIERAKLQLTDPLSFFEDTGVANPKERTRRLLAFSTDPITYLEEFVQKAPSLEGRSEGGQQQAQGGQQGQGNQQALMDIAQLQQGGNVQPPQQLQPGYAQTISKFIQSSEFQALDPQAQQNIANYASQVVGGGG